MDSGDEVFHWLLLTETEMIYLIADGAMKDIPYSRWSYKLYTL